MDESERDIIQIRRRSSWIHRTPSLKFIESHMTEEDIGEIQPYETIFEKALRSATIVCIKQFITYSDYYH